MEKMKSLADQLREQMTKTVDRPGVVKTEQEGGHQKKPATKKKTVGDAPIIQQLTDYNNSDHKIMVHYRFDKQTVDFLNQFKIATGIDATKFVAYSVRQFIDQHPELKKIIKEFIQNAYL